MLREVLIWPNPVLSQKSEEVSEVTDTVRRVLEDMAETMLHVRGAGLAAIQVGVPQRLITLLVRTQQGGAVLKLVNPVIAERRNLVRVREGCLSLPGCSDFVQRYGNITVNALDETGAEVSIPCDGKLAQALQHEIEHLDGKVFADLLSPLKREMMRKKLAKLVKKGMRYPATQVEITLNGERVSSILDSLPPEAVDWAKPVSTL